MPNEKEIEKYIDDLKGPGKFSHTLLWVSFAAIMAFFIWAYFAKLDEVTHADGRVIPSRKIQLIQNLEGGIVKDILVHEGQIVEKNQIIMELSKVQFSAEFKENRAKLLAAEIQFVMLEALVNKKPFVPSEQLKSARPKLVNSQIALYNSKVSEVRTMLENKRLIAEEIEMTKPLLKSGSASKVELLRLQQQFSDIQHKIHNAQSAALNNLNNTKADWDRLNETVKKYQDKLTRTTVRSPVKGIIKQLHVNTLGGVIKPGDSMIEIVPVDDTLLVEAKVKPSDIGFIHIGQNANVKITAYDCSIYGGFDGKIEHISADTSIDKRSEHQDSFYEVWIRTDKNYLTHNDKKLTIIPGMTANVDILTGKKTVLDYLLKPILKAKDTAMRER